MDSFQLDSLNIGYWNINGHTSKYLGDKLLDREFVDVVNTCDIIGLGELQAKGDVDIPGFKSIKQKVREKKCAGPKIAGGLGVYVKDYLYDFVDLVPNSCPDAIWIRLKNEDVYLGTYYVSPKYSKSRDIDFFNTLNDEILHFKSMGTVFLQGDLNARTGTDSDFIQMGKCYEPSEEELGEIDAQEDVDIYLRNSEDKTVNSRGRELLDLCKLNRFLIVNGRKTGDVFGKNTCHNWNGSSVVDYFLSPISSFDSISTFAVGNYIPWLSDHCLIRSKILLRGNYSKSDKTEELIDSHPGFVWNETSMASYKTQLEGDTAKLKANDLMNASYPDTQELASNICKFMLETVTLADVKEKKSIQGGSWE